MTVLDDVVLHLQDVARPPSDLTRYLVIALRNRVRTRYRDENRRYSSDARAVSTLEATGQCVIAECHSEYGLRLAVAPGSDPLPPLASAIERLAIVSKRALSRDDLVLMIGLGHRVPLRELAAQAGISYGAARVRVHRVRARFLAIANAHVDSLQPDEEREMRRFFRRAGVTLASPLRVGESAQHEPPGTLPLSIEDTLP